MKLFTHFSARGRAKLYFHTPTACQPCAAQKILAAGFAAHRLAQTWKEETGYSAQYHNSPFAWIH
jgi:hypothetical protein